MKILEELKRLSKEAPPSGEIGYYDYIKKEVIMFEHKDDDMILIERKDLKKLIAVAEAAEIREWHYIGGDDAPELEKALAALEDENGK